jgi:hypothetical protein
VTEHLTYVDNCAGFPDICETKITIRVNRRMAHSAFGEVSTVSIKKYLGSYVQPTVRVTDAYRHPRPPSRLSRERALGYFALPTLLSFLLLLAAIGGLAAGTSAQVSGPTLFDDFDTSLAYSGLWNHEAQWPLAHNSTLSYSNAGGASAKVQVTGESLTYIFTKAHNRGIVSVLVDGIQQEAVDLYSPIVKWRVGKTYSFPRGTHTVEFQVTGQKHRASTNTYVDIDELIVDLAPSARGVYDDGAAPIIYVGAWTHDGPPGGSWPAANDATVSYANFQEAASGGPPAASFVFTGDEVTYFFTKAYNRGHVAITIDGIDRGVVDLYAPENQTGWQSSVTFSGLGSAIHYLHIAAAPQRNPSSSGGFIDIDALLVGREFRCHTGPPTVLLTVIPALRTSERLEGRACNVNPEDYRILVYIKVGDGWWIKPYADQPQTPIQARGFWSTNTVTGGQDSLASEMAAYLVKPDFPPPILRGDTTIPARLEQNAVAKAWIRRETPPRRITGPVLAPIKSSFDAGLEGWTNTGGIRFAGNIGNSSGSMQFQELYVAEDGFAFAPEKFLGSWTHFGDSASLSFQHRVSTRGGGPPGFWGAARPRQIRLSGPGGSAIWTGGVPTFSENWTTIEVPLNPAQWTVTNGTWLRLMEQVGSLQLGVDLFNDLFGVERTEFDNVQLLPQ